MQLEIYQHIPEHINPIIFQIGFFSIRWYSIMYLVGFAVVYGLLLYRKKEMVSQKVQSSKFKVQNDSLKLKVNSKIQNTKYEIPNTVSVLDLMFYLVIGLLIGARLGYVLFYNFNYYYHNLLEIFFPIQIMNYELQITGIYGMSYFGGLIGIIIAGLIFVRLRGSASLNQSGQNPPAGEAGRPSLLNNFWKLADFVVPVVPAGYFFGRIGNFLNGELYGRVTDVPWGMYFPADPHGLLRHPSQLYEAFFEGIVLFVILWFLRNIKMCHPEWSEGSRSDIAGLNNSGFLTGLGMTRGGFLLSLYLFGYGLFRFFIEFFRQPDSQIGLFFGWLSLGQVFSAIAIITAAFIILIGKKPGVSQHAKNGL